MLSRYYIADPTEKHSHSAAAIAQFSPAGNLPRIMRKFGRILGMRTIQISDFAPCPARFVYLLFVSFLIVSE